MIKQSEADLALKEISTAMERAAERKQETEVLQKNLQEEEMKINQAKQKIQVELEDIQPLVNQARKAVGSINKGNLDELKGKILF